MPIHFLDLLADDRWAPVRLVPEGAGSDWSDGGTLADAPVDTRATFEGARRSTGLDPAFGLHGVRLVPGFEGPRRCHDRPTLMIVFGGTLVVRSEPDAGGGGGAVEDRLVAGQFCVVEEATVHSVSAGDEGVTYTECWPQDADGAETRWYPGDAWVSA